MLCILFTLIQLILNMTLEVAIAVDNVSPETLGARYVQIQISKQVNRTQMAYVTYQPQQGVGQAPWHHRYTISADAVSDSAS